MAHKIEIPYDVIEEHINCSICLSTIRGAILTPCGHRYCNKCITEWVGRNHSCPCCNRALNTENFYFDVQFDALVDAALVERDKKEEEYFEKMFTAESPDSEGPANVFEKILKKHMKKSLFSHQQYFAKLKQDYEKKIHLLGTGIGEETLNLGGLSINGGSAEDIKLALTQNLEESERLAADAFDRYLTQNVPRLEMLPVTVTVYVANKNIRIENVIIKPSDRLSVIKQAVDLAMQQRSDDVISWAENGGTCILVSPIYKSNQYNLDMVKKLVGQQHGIHVLSWDSLPVVQCSMRPGSEIILFDAFQSQSDLPKECFVNVYDKSGSQSCDYYTCENCNVKWICKSCIQCCHSGHSVAPFTLQHKPTWACCYCPKKNLCTIQRTLKA